MSRITSRHPRAHGRRSQPDQHKKGCCARCHKPLKHGIAVEHRGRKVLVGRECLNQAFGRRGKFSSEEMALERRSYLPKEIRDLPPFKPEGTDLEIWVWDDHGRHYAIAFAGKAGKPLGHFSFKSDENRMKWMQEQIRSRQGHAARLKKELEERRGYRHDFKVGDILDSSWGYDQTNIDFYEVIEVSEKTIVVRKIGSRVVESKAGGADYVAAQPGKYIGEPKRVTPRVGGYVTIDGHSASKWDGRPRYETAMGWGH